MKRNRAIVGDRVFHSAQWSNRRLHVGAASFRAPQHYPVSLCQYLCCCLLILLTTHLSVFIRSIHFLCTIMLNSSNHPQNKMLCIVIVLSFAGSSCRFYHSHMNKQNKLPRFPSALLLHRNLAFDELISSLS